MKIVHKTAAAAALALTASLCMGQAPKPAAKGDPKLHECRQHNMAEHRQVMEIHAKAKKEHMISKGEEKSFHEMEQRLHAHQAALSKDGLTLAECERLGKEIAHEKERIEKMAATPVKAPAKK